MSVNDKLTAIADAIREKTGNADKLTLDGMAGEIRAFGIGDENMMGVWLINENPNITNESDFDVSVKGMFHYFDGTDFKELDLSRLRLDYDENYGDGYFSMYAKDGEATAYNTNQGWYSDSLRNVPDDTTLLRTLTLTEEPISPYLRNWLAANAVKISEADYYNQFWDAYQANGSRKAYAYAFYGEYWNDTTFKPKYDIVCDGSYTSNSMFTNAAVTTIPVKVDFSKCPTELYAVFSGCGNLKTIKEIVFNETHTFYATFNYCWALENLKVTGKIGTDINLQWSTKLSRNSLLDVYWAAVAGYELGKSPTLTLSLAAVNRAFETSEGAGDGSESYEWQNIINNTSFHIGLV